MRKGRGQQTSLSPHGSVTTVSAFGASPSVASSQIEAWYGEDCACSRKQRYNIFSFVLTIFDCDVN